MRVNKDLLRTMLHFDKWTGRNEGQTIAAEIAVATSLLADGINVVVDDTNLNKRVLDMWRRVSVVTEATIAYENMKTSVEECWMRDKYRANPVGKSVIVKMALEHGLFPMPKQGFVLCDLDGTLCDIQHRLVELSGPEKHWKPFFDGIPGDSVREETLSHLHHAVQEGHKVFFVSARPEDYRDLTEKWLEDQDLGFEYEGLIMRKSGDHRDDVVVKKEILDKYFAGYPIEFVIDDRPRVIQMWRDEGLHVIDVGNGVDF